MSPHQSGHIIIDQKSIVTHALKTPLTTHGKTRLWHSIVFLCTVCFVAGFILG